jgi:Mg-chelatase subunit ChlD
MRIALVLVMIASTAIAGPKKRHEHGTLVIVLDRSESMRGVRLDQAKEATRVAIAALDPSDDVAVIAFDSEAMFVWRPSVASKFKTGAIDRLQAGGGTNMVPALVEARDFLLDAKGKKHVLVLTDGETPEDGLDDVLATMSKATITITTVGVVGADRNLLNRIAEAGNGRVYMVDDLNVLPRVFVREVTTALPR